MVFDWQVRKRFQYHQAWLGTKYVERRDREKEREKLEGVGQGEGVFFQVKPKTRFGRNPSGEEKPNFGAPESSSWLVRLCLLDSTH